jgi:hypothetical protein
MADWNQPVLATAYATWHSEMQARDVNALTLADTRLAAMTNIPTRAKRWDDTGKTFEDWTGAAWTDLVIGVAGGGTGSATAAGARTNLGLGTMAVQNAAAVAITGGTALLSAITTVDDTLTIGTSAAQAHSALFKSGLKIPVGVNKWLT